MALNTIKTLKLAHGLASALGNIASSETGGVGPLESGTIKKKTADCYDYNAAFGADVCWNWGMWKEEIHRDISRKIASYDQYESDGNSEQLYVYALKQVPVHGDRPLKILEVGSGTGRGLNFLSRLERRNSFVGLDISAEAVDRANARFAREGTLSYVKGDAEALPFDSGEFDIVLNIESSHNYPNLLNFFGEVARVLRPGGFFSHADAFTDSRLALMRTCIQQTSDRFRWREEEDISDYVKESIRRRMAPNSLFRKRIKDALPWPASAALVVLAMRAWGARFVEEAGATAGRERRSTPWHLPATSYRHTLAVKISSP